MAFANALLKKEGENEAKEAPIGFSWTVLFFGLFVPILREDWKWFVVMLLLTLFLGPIVILYNLAMAMIYNRIFFRGLIKKGYTVVEVEAENEYDEEKANIWILWYLDK